MRPSSHAPLALVLVLALCLPVGAARIVVGEEPPPLEATVAAPTATQQYIVGFHATPTLAPGDAYGGGRVVATEPALRFVVVATEEPALLHAHATLDEDVRYVEWDDPAFGVALLVPNDARYGDAGHYGSKKIRAETAWDRTLGSTAVKIAVIDSGLRRTHEEFAGQSRILQGWDAISEDAEPQDTCGHGTHVTGTIAATIDNGKGIAGMAQVTVYPIRALTATLILCSGSTADLAQALRIAADQGAAASSNSWGGGSATSITDAISYSYGKGTAVVAAAGNDGSCTNCVSEPWRSNAAKVVVVSSTDANDALSSFSSQGPQVDVAAPGSSILSTYSSNDASYSTLSGTSMATPHVTGTLALVKTLNPTLGPAELEDHLKATAVDLGAAGKDDRFGHGRIDAAAATAGGTAPPAACADGLDNDGDGLVDHPSDPGCTSSSDTDETNAPPPNAPPTAAFSTSTSGLTVSVDGRASSDADGTIASYSWDWGDETSAGSGATASHAYAAAGTYTVTLTVTDDDGATDTESATVTVSSPSDPDPDAFTLTNGVAKSDTSGGAGSEKFYKISVPAGMSQLQVVLDGPACGLLSCSADLDLYVRKGARPTDSAYDCRPYEGDSDETCTLAGPGADWWYVRVDVYSGSNGSYTIRATYS